MPFVILVLVGTSNALNLTDGLDGLAVGCTIFAVAAFSIISYVVGHAEFARYLSLGHIPEAGETVELTAFDPDELSAHPPRWLARVVRMDGRRIDILALTKLGAGDG